MLSKKPTKLLLLLLLLTVNLLAIDGKIKVFISSHDTIYTSQKVTVSVELLSDAFSITDTKITFPASKKYIVQAPQSASYLDQEEVGDENWQMVHYDYEVYALQTGKIEIPSVAISFTASMGYGQPKKEFVLKSAALSFDVKTPKGVKADQFVLVTDNFRLTSEIKPVKEKLIVGDAFELSVTQEAHGVPDVLLTPIIYKSNAFLRVYEKEPELKSALSGKYDVSRTDRFTLVASGEGNVTLPEQEILWYNSITEEMHVEKIPSIDYEILPDPQIAIDAKNAQQKQLLINGVLILLILLGLYTVLAPKIRHYNKERKRQYEESEAGKFAMLLTTVESGDATSIDRQYYLWLFSIAPELARGGIKAVEIIQPSFSDVLKELDLVMIKPNTNFDRVRFSSEVQTFREKLLQEKKSTKQGLPITINPL